MTGSIGPLLGADEFFHHQIVETFASVAQTDPSWTEKVWVMAAARDGSLQIGFGLGKYPNRNVVDGYAGVSRGVEQWNVRASRELSSDPESVNVGPLRYQIVDPLKSIRIGLQPNDVQPIAFDLTLDAVTPCVVEDREDRRTPSGYRRTADQIRFHQAGVPRGWIEVQGVRTEVNADEWVTLRDRSWGIRPAVGAPIPDMAVDQQEAAGMRVLALWTVVLFEAPDRSRYAWHQYTLRYEGQGFRHESTQGRFSFPDGHIERVRDIGTRMTFDPRNRRFLSGEYDITDHHGGRRTLRSQPLPQGTGFHLGGGLYHGFDGKFHGQWRGKLASEGEYFADCSTAQSAERLGQFRDCLVQVQDSATGATGWGTCQTYIAGAWPEMGLR